MKKHILFLSALAAVSGLMTSCSDDDMISSSHPIPDARAIVFSTGSTSSSSTRSGVTVTSLDKFTVNAVTDEDKAYYSSVSYVYNADKGIFESETPYYWPTTGNLSFYAINHEGTKQLTTETVPRYTYTAWSGEKDLVAATVIAGEKTIPYPLTFRHLNSQIMVSAEAEDKTEALTYKLVGVKMTAPSTGTYSFAGTTGETGSWQIDNEKTTSYSYNDVLPASFSHNGQVELSSCYWNILPVTDGEITFDIEYQVIQNGKIISDYTGSNKKTLTVTNPNLEPGYIYRYNLILTRGTDDEITFTLTVNDWENGSVSNQTPASPLNVDTNGYEYVDMGLPTGTLWATCNIGQDTPTSNISSLFKWGETVPTTTSTKDDYKFWDSSTNSYTKYFIADCGFTNLQPEDDAAHVNMGGDWHMPDYDVINELLANTIKSVSGSILTLTSKSDPTKQLQFYLKFDDSYGIYYVCWINNNLKSVIGAAPYWNKDASSDHAISETFGATRGAYRPAYVRGVITPAKK